MDWDAFKEEWLLDTFDSFLCYSSHCIGLGGLDYYLRKDYVLYRNLYLNYREYFWVFESSGKADYINNIKR